MSSLAERLKQSRKKINKTQVDVAKEAGMTQPSYQGLENGRNKKTAHINKLASILGVDALWLETGKKTERGDSKNNTTLSKPNEAKIVFLKDFSLLAYKYKTISEAMANEHRRLRISKHTLDNLGIYHDKVFACTATGDSMEPEIKNESTVFVDTNRTTIKDGYIYAIEHGGEFRIKRLFRMPMGGVRIVSDNADKDLYPTQELTAEQIQQQQFRVFGWVWQISTFNRW